MQGIARGETRTVTAGDKQVKITRAETKPTNGFPELSAAIGGRATGIEVVCKKGICCLADASAGLDYNVTHTRLDKCPLDQTNPSPNE